jgi:50S ribosomal protein L16 3-hydroxylase
MDVLDRLGALTITRFLRDYWQRRPVVIRDALTGFAPPVRRRELLALCAREDIESRLVIRSGQRWALNHGPFARRALPPLSRRGWTVLIQGLDLVDADAARLMQRFRFLPQARLDDLMASFATDGGGVPAHVDSYDVFLLQTEGRRRWRISQQRDQRLRPGLPVQLLADFRPTREWLLEPGDLLYLPPGIAHEGTAVGPCVGYSIGFRTPTWAELLDPWFARFAERHEVRGRYADPGIRATRHPGRLPAAMVARTHAALSRARPARADTEWFLLEHLSEPKAHVVFSPRRKRMSAAAFQRAVRRHGLVLDRRSRLLYGRDALACNGEAHDLPPAWRPLLHRFADHQRLLPAELAGAPPALLGLLASWHDAGWLHLPVRAAP